VQIAVAAAASRSHQRTAEPRPASGESLDFPRCVPPCFGRGGDLVERARTWQRPRSKTTRLNGEVAGRIEFGGEVGAAVSLVVENGRITRAT
jgi:hypothetical protein